MTAAAVPAPAVATVTAATAATTATTATAITTFLAQLGQVPVSSDMLTGLLKQYANKLYCAKLSKSAVNAS